MLPVSRYQVPIALALVGTLGIGCGAPPDTLNAINSTNSSGPSNPVSSADSKTVTSGAAGTEPLVQTKSAVDPETFSGGAKKIVDWTGAISNLYGTYQAATAILTAIGILQDSNRDNDILVQLQALHQEIDHATQQVTWFIAESDREKRLSDMRSSVLTTHDAVNSGATVDWFDLDLNSGKSVAEAADPTAFERYYVDSDTDGALVSSPQWSFITWKNLISYSQQDLQDENGYVYDWRLGLPALLQLIGLRIQLMAMEDPNFTTDGRFHDELMSYYNDLATHIQNLNAGLRCNLNTLQPIPYPDTGPAYPNYEFWISCADIFSGLNDTQVLLYSWDSYPLSIASCLVPGSDPARYDQDCLNQQGVDYTNWYQTNIQGALTQAYYNVRYQTPWFGVQAMMDTLYVYANGLTDPTKADSAIHVSANTGLCLDVFGASTDPETPVEIYTCNGNPASQSWAYDRESQNIVETYSGLCLDVINGNPTPGTLLWTYGCNGTDAQRWSYDPVNQIFNNALGNVLDVPNDNLQSLQRVQTGPWTGGDSQRWQ